MIVMEWRIYPWIEAKKILGGLRLSIGQHLALRYLVLRRPTQEAQNSLVKIVTLFSLFGYKGTFLFGYIIKVQRVGWKLWEFTCQTRRRVQKGIGFPFGYQESRTKKEPSMPQTTIKKQLTFTSTRFYFGCDIFTFLL